MLTLYDYQPSLNGWKVRVLMGLLNMSYRSHEVALFQGEAKSEVFLKLNPIGAIPVLEIDDGRAIAESSAILVYLAEGTWFLPIERFDRAKVLQWLSFEQYYLEPTIGSLRFWALTGRLEGNTGRMVETRRENGERALAAVARTLSDAQFLVGDSLTIADIAVYAYTHRAEECGFSFDSYPALSAWFKRVELEIGLAYPVPPYTADALLG